MYCLKCHAFVTCVESTRVLLFAMCLLRVVSTRVLFSTRVLSKMMCLFRVLSAHRWSSLTCVCYVGSVNACCPVIHVFVTIFRFMCFLLQLHLEQLAKYNILKTPGSVTCNMK